MENRSLTYDEYRLACWMLENGIPEAKNFLPQLELAEVRPWRCKCGCATIKFQIKGQSVAPPGVHVLAEFVFDQDDKLNGIMIYSSAGVLSSIEVFRLSGDIPKSLPAAESLRACPRQEQIGPLPPSG